eukprot:gene3288-biopygen667
MLFTRNSCVLLRVWCGNFKVCGNMHFAPIHQVYDALPAPPDQKSFSTDVLFGPKVPIYMRPKLFVDLLLSTRSMLGEHRERYINGSGCCCGALQWLPRLPAGNTAARRVRREGSAQCKVREGIRRCARIEHAPASSGLFPLVAAALLRLWARPHRLNLNEAGLARVRTAAEWDGSA